MKKHRYTCSSCRTEVYLSKKIRENEVAVLCSDSCQDEWEEGEINLNGRLTRKPVVANLANSLSPAGLAPVGH